MGDDDIADFSRLAHSHSILLSLLTFQISLPVSFKDHRLVSSRLRSLFYILNFSKSVKVLLILLNTGSLVSVLGDNGDGVLGAMSSEPSGLHTLLRGLGLCLASRAKS